MELANRGIANGRVGYCLLRASRNMDSGAPGIAIFWSAIISTHCALRVYGTARPEKAVKIDEAAVAWS